MLREIIRKNDRWYVGCRLVAMGYQRIRYRLYGVDITCRIVFPGTISHDLQMGAYSFVNRGAWICERVVIGKYTMLGPGVTIAGSDHCVDVPGIPMYFAGRPDLLTTNIGDDVWIGSRACIAAGVCIGRGVVVGMGAVVTRDVAPYSIVGGVPAKVIRMRFEDESEREQHDMMLEAGARRWGRFCRNRQRSME